VKRLLGDLEMDVRITLNRLIEKKKDYGAAVET
jgi:hypothetical protein